MGISRARALAALLALALFAGTPGCKRRAEPLPELELPTMPSRIEWPAAAPGPRPNLILVSIDTLRADRLGAYGHDRPTSPNIDALAAESVLFERAHSHSPKTAPSHMTLFTGIYPEAHRVKNRNVSHRRLSETIPTLAEMLRAAGYRTEARMAGGNVEGALGFARGFEHYEKPEMANAYAIFEAAVEALEGLAADDAPFFLFVHTYEPHAPYLAPKPFQDLFVDPDYAGRIVSTHAELVGDRWQYQDAHAEFWKRVDRKSPADRQHLLDLYDACIRFTDHRLGRLLERVDALGLADDTLVVLLSDHGEEFGEHEGFEHNALWQELLHVPLVMRVPERVRPGWGARRIPDLVGLVDVLPTLLELLDLPAPAHLQGRSLVPLVEDGAPGPSWHFAQHRHQGKAALRAGDWKVLRGPRDEQLFDLASDPAERHDAAAAHPEVRRAVDEQIDRVLQASRAYWRLAEEGGELVPDREELEQLRALGYLEDEGEAEPAP